MYIVIALQDTTDILQSSQGAVKARPLSWG